MYVFLIVLGIVIVITGLGFLCSYLMEVANGIWSMFVPMAKRFCEINQYVSKSLQTLIFLMLAHVTITICVEVIITSAYSCTGNHIALIGIIMLFVAILQNKLFHYSFQFYVYCFLYLQVIYILM